MKYIRMILLGLCCVLALSGCSFFDSEEDEDNVVYVYNWGDYVDPDTLKQFEEETGIRVVMDEFDTKESMYPLVAAVAEHYDVICPSDYMIQKMIHNDLLQPLDYSQLPNARQYVGKQFWTQSETFDPGNRYAVPIAGAQSASSTTGPWSMNLSTAGPSFGMRNIRMKSSCRTRRAIPSWAP